MKETPKAPRTIPEESEEEAKEEPKEESKRIKFADLSSDSESSNEEIPKARMNIAGYGKEKSMVIPKVNPIQDSDKKGKRIMRHTTSQNISYDKLSDEHSELEEYKVHFSPNYFIHEYSSDTDGGSVKSCDARIRIHNNEKYSEIHIDQKNNSEQDLKYYQDIDDDGILGIQNALAIDHIRENPEIYSPPIQGNLQSLILKNDFVKRIFPVSKEEKPGYDLYNFGVVFQFSVVVYILFFFSQMTGENEELSETFKFKRFRTEMIFFMFIQIMLILLDRFFYISNTFDQIQTESEDSESEDINLLNSENRHNLIKLVIYFVLVILVHITVVWYFPLTGNYKINEQIF